MKSIMAATAAVALFAAAPAFADSTDANSSGGKPASSANPTTNSPAAKNDKAYDSTGASAGLSGTSDEKPLPGAADSTKPDSSLSTNGNKPKQ